MRRITRFESLIIVLALAGACLPWATVAIGEGQDKDVICHRGNEITVADPAILQAHLLHGDCVGTCFDCEGRCCIQGGSSFVLTQFDCTQIGGRFQWDRDADCSFGAVD